jgi:hypothetical protein
MLRVIVQSSVIASIGYSRSDETLEVQFHTGRVYQYERVPPERHAALMAAESIGSYFNENIRDRYASKELAAD